VGWVFFTCFGDLKPPEVLGALVEPVGIQFLGLDMVYEDSSSDRKKMIQMLLRPIEVGRAGISKGDPKLDKANFVGFLLWRDMHGRKKLVVRWLGKNSNVASALFNVAWRRWLTRFRIIHARDGADWSRD